MIQIDILIIHPNRIGQIERHVCQLAIEYRSQVQTLGNASFHFFKEVARLPLRKFQYMESANVHRHLCRLQVKKHCIHSAQVVHMTSLIVRRAKANSVFQHALAAVPDVLSY
ncbi:hypothetical protein D3C81_2008010 [compost metagenome]